MFRTEFGPDRPLPSPMLSALRRAKLRRVPPLLRMHQSKRTKWDAEGVLDLRSWLADQGRGTPVQVSQPVQLACWTKASTSEGGGIAVGSTAGVGLSSLGPKPLATSQAVFLKKQIRILAQLLLDWVLGYVSLLRQCC